MSQTPKTSPDGGSANPARAPLGSALPQRGPNPSRRSAGGAIEDATAAQRKHDGGMSKEERDLRISETAYLLAERRGFADGDPVADWLEAERIVDRELAKSVE